MYTIWLGLGLAALLTAGGGGGGAAAYTVVHSTGYGPAAGAMALRHTHSTAAAAHHTTTAGGHAVSYRATTGPYDGGHRASPGLYDGGHRTSPGPYDGGQRVSPGPYDGGQRVSPEPYDGGYRGVYDGVSTGAHEAGYGGAAMAGGAQPLGHGWLLLSAPPAVPAPPANTIEEEVSYAVAGSADDILYARPAAGGYRYRRRPPHARAPPRRPSPPPRRPAPPLIIRVHKHRIIRD